MLRGLRGNESLGFRLCGRGAVEEGVEGHRRDRGQDDAVAEDRLEGDGERLEEGRRHDRDQAEADRDGDDQHAVALLGVIDRR